MLWHIEFFNAGPYEAKNVKTLLLHFFLLSQPNFMRTFLTTWEYSHLLLLAIGKLLNFCGISKF